MPTLILLGGAGGVLRGVVDFYLQFANWRSARGARPRDGAPEDEPPRLTAYLDPAVDLAAAAVHSAMGAGTAVLFGATGQISGPYAALVVGASAPALLTQLARIQSVSEAVGAGPAAPADPAQQPVPSPPLPGPGTAAGAEGTPSTAVRPDPEPPAPPRPSPNGRPGTPPTGSGRGLRGEPAVGEEGRP